MTRYLITNDPGTAAHSAKNVHAEPGLPNRPRNDSKGRTPMVDTPRAISRSRFTAELDRAYATGYAYGRLDQRFRDECGPLVTSPELVSAARERAVSMGGFEELYAELQGAKAAESERGEG